MTVPKNTAMKTMVASTLRQTVTIVILAPLILVRRPLVAFTPQLCAMTITLAQLIPATLPTDVLIHL